MSEEVAGAGVPAPRAPSIWLPQRGPVHLADESACIGIVGPSGGGKTTLLRQLALDPFYAGRIYVQASENPTATIGGDLCAHISEKREAALYWEEVTDAEDALRKLDELVAARKRGEKMPLVGATDSITGIADYQTKKYHLNPQMFIGDEGKKNTFAKFLDLGMVMRMIQMKCRDELGIDWIIMGTTTPPKPGQPPQLCIDGNMVPSNFTRLTTATLYLQPREARYKNFDVEKSVIESASHRSVGYVREPDGSTTAVVVDRWFTTQNTGEIMAKGHRALGLEEKADLPMILAKLHGRVK